MNPEVPQRRSIPWVALAAVTGVFLLHGITLCRAVYPWGDEVMHVDPGANWALGHGFTSTAWTFQDAHAFFSGYPPLHAFVVGVFLRLWGFGMLQARLPALLAAWAGTLVVVSCSAACGMLTRRSSQLAVGLTLAGCYSLMFLHQANRPDAIGFLVASVGFAGATLKARGPRVVVLFLSSFGLPWYGIQAGVALAAAGIMVLGLHRRRFFPEVVAAFAGAGLGAAAVFALFAHHGTLGDFLAHVSQRSAGWRHGQSLERMIRGSMGAFKDPTLLATWGVLLAAAIRGEGDGVRRLARHGVAFSACLCACLFAAAHIGIYYGWIFLVPAVVAWGALWERFQVRPWWWAAPLAVSLVFCAALKFVAFADWDARDYSRIIATARAAVPPGSIVAATHGPYYAIKPTAGRLYLPYFFPRLSAAERSQVEWIVSEKESAQVMMREFPGEWVLVAESPPGSRLLPASPNSMFFYVSDLTVWRRVKVAVSAEGAR
jgi:hypothetical protein